MVEVRFPASGLSAEYGDIVIGNVAGTVSVEVRHSGTLILSEIYSPDADGAIAIRDLGELAILYKPEIPFSFDNGLDGTIVSLTVTLTEGAQVIERVVAFYPSIVDFSGSLTVDLLKSIPLSRCTQKSTGVGRKEFISFYGGSAVTVYVVYKGDSGDSAATTQLSASPGANTNYYRFDVSPAVIAAMLEIAESDLVYYNVYTSTDSIIRFTMDERRYPQQRNFVFRNCFGAQENFTCTGDEISERKWTRAFGNVDNKQISLSRDLENKFTVNTGFITAEEVEVLEDLLNSDRVSLIDEYGFQDITILEESFRVTSRRDELTQIEFTYKFSQNNQFKTSYKPFRKPRIFTTEFDETFN